MDNPFVTIVTPSFNKGEFIEETIQSVLKQTYKNIEYIVIDGGSTDDTLSILKRYPLTWIQEPDAGQSDAINKGWRLAKGSILAYLNADDTYLPNTVEKVVNHFNEHPDCEMVYGDAIYTDEKGTLIKNHVAGEFNLDDLLSCKDEIPQPSVFIRKKVFEYLGGLDTHLKLAMDLDYWIQIGLRYKVDYIPEVLSKVKFYRDAASTKHSLDYVHEYEYIINQLPWNQNTCYSRMYYRFSKECFVQGRKDLALKYLWLATQRWIGL